MGKRNIHNNHINILLITSDEQRWDHIGYDGDGILKTPVLDSLTRQGVVFHSTYTTSPMCVPARASLLTGQYMSRHGVPIRGFLPQESWTVPRELQANGYQTAAIGKMHFHPMYADHGLDIMRLAEDDPSLKPFGADDGDDYHRFLHAHGYRDWHTEWQFPSEFPKSPPAFQRRFQAVVSNLPEPFHSSSWIAEEAIKFLENSDKDKPFFVWLSFLKPHSPFNPPSPYDLLYDPDNIHLPCQERGEIDRLPVSLRNGLEKTVWRTVDWMNLDEMVFRQVIAYEYGCITHMDHCIGRVLQHINMRNTAIIFTSDHGDYMGHRRLLSKSPYSAYDCLTRVPLIIAPPDIESLGKEVVNIVSHVDIAPTILKMAGIEIPYALEGKALQNYLDSPHYGQDRIIFCEVHAPDKAVMARWQKWKYVFYPFDETDIFFNLKKDPNELYNLLPEVKGEEKKIAYFLRKEIINFLGNRK